MRVSLYEMIERIFKSDYEAGIIDTAYVEEWTYKLDVFYAGGRLTHEEYQKLVDLLNSYAPASK